jgi:hypothetical protein
MSSPYESKARIDEIRRCIETKGDLLGLREHLQTVVSGSAFRGSARSGQFLKHVVSLALAGDIDSLKERSIGIELFGRTPSYDTGEDAIVRVTASDVRKRLAQHYATVGAEPEFRINLPPGSYIPEILHGNRKLSNVDAPKPDIFASLDLPSSPATPLESKIEVPAKSSPTHNLPQWIGGFALALLLAVSGLWLAGRTWVLTISPRVSVLPWSTLFHSSRPILLITSDPNIAEIQALAGAHISVSDYANQNYIPKVASMSPEAIAFSRNILRGNKADSVDTPIIARVAELAGRNSIGISVRAARDVRFSDLDTDNPIIFLGSPTTDPWTNLFADQLDFRFTYDDASGPGNHPELSCSHRRARRLYSHGKGIWHRSVFCDCQLRQKSQSLGGRFARRRRQC